MFIAVGEFTGLCFEGLREHRVFRRVREAKVAETRSKGESGAGGG